MTPLCPPEALYWGLKLVDWATISGLFLGPIVAVIISLWRDQKLQVRQRRLQTMGMLLATRHLAGDAGYSTAINMIPVEFNDRLEVMQAWREYIAHVRQNPTQENSIVHEQDTNAKQTTLIFKIMQDLGFKLSETDIQTSAYAAGGLIARDNLMLKGWEAWVRIANALEAQIPSDLNGEKR